MSPGFSAWREGSRFYLPLLLVGGVLSLVGTPFGWWYVGTPVAALGAFALYFFRDPPRAIPSDAQGIVCPADGAIVGIEDLEETPHYDGPCRRVSIFLSVLDVHVNRAPASGTIRKILYAPGQFKNAMRPETTETNESNAVWMDTEFGPVTVRQISGAIARRIVCVSKAEERLEKGQKFGMIKLGSRTELYLPPDTDICVKLKDKVKAGSSPVGHFS